jgi:hypothetical protein
MTVGELKEALNQFDDNLEVFTKKTDFVGNIGYIFNVKQDTYGFFGESLPCILLTDQIEDEDR